MLVRSIASLLVFLTLGGCAFTPVPVHDPRQVTVDAPVIYLPLYCYSCYYPYYYGPYYGHPHRRR
jgi:hypothetical protein